MKTCRKCHTDQPNACFHKCSRNSDGLQSYCKGCNKYKPAAQRRAHIKYRYDLTVEEYDIMLAEQDGACAICDAAFKSTPHIDHCHDTGVVRGLLCRACNTALGGMQDNPRILERAIQYLTKSQPLGSDEKPVATTTEKESITS